MRSEAELHAVDVSEWTEEEGFWHLRKTFDGACREYPEVMEPYLNRSADLDGRGEAKEFMRDALRETFKDRRITRQAASHGETKAKTLRPSRSGS